MPKLGHMFTSTQRWQGSQHYWQLNRTTSSREMSSSKSRHCFFHLLIHSLIQCIQFVSVHNMTGTVIGVKDKAGSITASPCSHGAYILIAIFLCWYVEFSNPPSLKDSRQGNWVLNNFFFLNNISEVQCCYKFNEDWNQEVFRVGAFSLYSVSPVKEACICRGLWWDKKPLMKTQSSKHRCRI